MTEKNCALERLTGAILHSQMLNCELVKLPLKTALEIKSEVSKRIEPLWPKRNQTVIGSTMYTEYFCAECLRPVRQIDKFCWYCGRKIKWDG